MPFFSATENMAALLRSARLLKLSPSGSLQLTGTKRTGPALSRLYSGALSASSRAGVCPRQIRLASENASSRVWLQAAGCVRTYAVVTEQKDETSNLLKTKQAQEFDWALTKLDSSVRRTGRITKNLLLRIFHDICRTGYPSGNQALLLLRSCGSLLPEMPMQERSELAHRVWEKLQKLGVNYDVSHYNALLKVYLQNEFKFSPMDFLAKMEAANIQPNRVSYQRLIAAYCQNGDIEGASTILGFMKSKDLPITEAVFNSLVTGHARAGDIESAKNILTVMRGAGIEPSADTYVSLICAYAEKGDLDAVKKTLEKAESEDCTLMDRDFMQIIFTLAKAGQQQHVPEMVERLRQESSYVPEAMNLCLSLITQGLEDTAFHMLKTFPSPPSEDTGSDSPKLGNFFLRHCVTMNVPPEKIAIYCKELQESNRHNMPLSFTLSCALETKKTGMSLQLMKLLKEQGFPIRPHYFWPLLSQYVKDKDTAGVLEVMKGMEELGVSPDIETISTYSLPAFQSGDAALQALKDAGVSLVSEGYLASEMRSLVFKDLAKFYARLSDPSFPSMDFSAFRQSLIHSFKKSQDVETMVKITVLLYNDKRFSKGSSKPAERVRFLLYNLIDNMTESEVQAQEGKLQKYFSELQNQNITITESIFKGIKNLLDSYQAPKLIEYVNALLDTKEEESDVSVPAPLPRVNGAELNAHALEDKLAELKAENKPLGSIVKQVIQAHCSEENLQRALELKQQYEEEMTVPVYASLLNLCCRHDNVDEALNLKRELSRKDSSAVLRPNKYIVLVKALCKNNKVEEALDILKEMKEKGVALDDVNIANVFHALNALAAEGASPDIQRLLDTIFTLGLAKPSSNLCSTLITSYLNRSDLSGALEAVMECHKRYKLMPHMHELNVALVEKGETELLQKAMDFVSQTRGEMAMLYDLFFAFLFTGRYREARKIIETPGLRARAGSLQWFADKCIFGNRMEALEHMVDMTAKLFDCDRDEMYSFVLRLCKETNDWQKAEAIWTKMQEENVIPRERTLRLLADILKNNNQEVPFEVPEIWYEEADNKQKVQPETLAESSVEWGSRIMSLCKKGKAKEAFKVLEDANRKGVALDPAPYDHVIRGLLASGAMKEALAVQNVAASFFPGFQLSETATSLLIVTQSKKGQTKDALKTMRSMLSANQVPLQIAITRLIQAFGTQGDVAGIEEVVSLIKDFNLIGNLSSMVFINNTALAHIKNGHLELAVELLEGVFTGPGSTNQSISFVFQKVLEQGNEEALDKLSAMAERLANHFACYRPASDLFFQLLEMDKIEDAKFMLARCNALAEQKSQLLSYVSRKAQTPGQVGKIKTLLSLIPDFAEKEILCAYLMKCHYMDKDLSSAKALYDQMQEEGLVIDDLSLKRVAELYANEGQTPPFPVPPESFKFYAGKLKEQRGDDKAQAEE